MIFEVKKYYRREKHQAAQQPLTMILYKEDRQKQFYRIGANVTFWENAI